MRRTVIYDIYFRPEANEYCENGGFETRTALFDCIQNGDVEKFPETLSVYLKLLKQHINGNLEYSKASILYTSAQLQIIAMQGGMPVKNCHSIQEAYYRALDEAENVDQALMVLSNQCFDLIHLINKMNKEKQYSEDVQACCNFIRANVYKKISLADISEYIHLSISYISAKFKAETGCSISQYIRKEKIREAKTLLSTDMSLLDIAMELGFATQSHFTESFKKECGITPMQFRKNK